jgi:hypothetical protein
MKVRFSITTEPQISLTLHGDIVVRYFDVGFFSDEY